jgi:hypothetical protein
MRGLSMHMPCSGSLQAENLSCLSNYTACLTAIQSKIQTSTTLENVFPDSKLPYPRRHPPSHWQMNVIETRSANRPLQHSADSIGRCGSDCPAPRSWDKAGKRKRPGCCELKVHLSAAKFLGGCRSLGQAACVQEQIHMKYPCGLLTGL